MSANERPSSHCQKLCLEASALRIITSASFNRPWEMSHRGDSGMNLEVQGAISLRPSCPRDQEPKQGFVACCCPLVKAEQKTSAGRHPGGTGETHHQRAAHSTPGSVSASSSIRQSLMNEGERQKERKRMDLKQTPCPARSPTWAQSHDPEIMTGAEIKSQKLNQLCHPGIPPLMILNNPQDLVLALQKQA